MDAAILLAIQLTNATIGWCAPPPAATLHNNRHTHCAGDASPHTPRRRRYETRKSGNAVAALKASLKPEATCKRDGKMVTINAAELVPGDLVLLGSGSAVPADCMVNEGRIEIDQAALTGAHTHPPSPSPRVHFSARTLSANAVGTIPAGVYVRVPGSCTQRV